MKLRDVAAYVTEKVQVSSLTNKTYIGVDNLLQNKAGVSDSEYLPQSGYAIAFKRNDILLGNIRPYFKKIWLAEFDGGCSPDVLCIRCKDVGHAKFLYAVLSQEAFFDYDMKGTKGSKMPRGDKSHIMNYDIPILRNFQSVGNLNKLIECKIHANKLINDNLEKQAQLIFDYMFRDLSGLKHVGDYIKPKRGTVLLSKDAVLGDIPVIAGGLEPAIYHNIANTLEPVVTISSSGANAGFVNLWGVPVWSSDSSYIDSAMTPYVYFWYAFLKRHQNNIYSIQTGSAQPHIYPSHIMALPIGDLDYEKVSQYTESVTPLFSMVAKNYKESKELSSLRDYLLPLLMNGQAYIED